jgi:hypothetical protein
MAIEKAMVTGTAGIMDWFDRNATSPYYSVWVNRKQLLFSWNDDDMEAGRSKLENDLYAIEQNNNNDLLIIKLHPKKDKAGYITDKTPIYGSLVCRASELEKPMYGMQPMGAIGYNSKMENVLERVLETQNAILTKLNAEELEEDEDEEEDKGMLGNIMNSPQVQALLMAGISKFLGIAGTETENMGASIAGIEVGETNEAITILNSLMNKGVTVDHLRKLDDMSGAKLKSLLLML